MRVLHCIPGMGGGGAERQLAYLAGPLVARGWEVHVAMVAGGPNLARLEAGGAVIHRLASRSSYDPRLILQLARVARRTKPDLVQAWFVQMDVLVAAVAPALRVPWVLSERSSALAYPPTWKNRLRVRLGRRASAIISNSSGGDAYWQEHGAERVPRFVIPNAVPIEEIEGTAPAIPEGLPIERDHAVVLTVSRFEHEKNIDVVFAACRQVVERPRTVAVLCGDGPLRSAIRRRIVDEGFSGRVFAPGYVMGLWPLLKRADVVLAAGTFEGRPNAVLESMAAARPLVVSDIPAHREILDDTTAAWVDARDPAAMAAVVRGMLDDPAGAARLAAAAASRATRWSLDTIAADYDRAYRAVLSRTSNR